MPVTSMPFGKHAGQPLEQVPTSYLCWLLTTCQLGSGLRAALVGELARRGVDAPPPAPRLARIPPCRPCTVAGLPDAGAFFSWQEDRAGRKRIRAECLRCRSFLAFAPQVEPFLAMADAFTSDTAVLDVLVEADEQQVELERDGRLAWLSWRDEQRASKKLRTLTRQCGHQLAGLVGRRAVSP